MIINHQLLVEQTRCKINEINANQFASELDTFPFIIDVREAEEIKLGMIPGAVHISRGVLEMNLCNHPALAKAKEPLQILAKSRILLYCRSGGRSALAVQSLMNMGLSQVYSLAGGMTAWQQAGFAVKI